MTTSATADGAAPRELDARTLARMVRVMFPHPFPDGPYDRTAAGIIAGAANDIRLHAQLDQGLRDLDARAAGGSFVDLDEPAALELLRSIDGTEFFESVRGNVITTLYDDPEVWDLLGYEGASFDKGGYVNRGFNDLDWLPEPRIEEAA